MTTIALSRYDCQIVDVLNQIVDVLKEQEGWPPAQWQQSWGGQFGVSTNRANYL